MLDDGIYGYSNEFYAMVIDGFARPYDIGWYGDLSEYEISVNRDVDVSDCETRSELIQKAYGLYWSPEKEDDVEFFPADELPFTYFPDVHPDGLPHNLLRRDSGMPFLDWLFDEARFLD